MQISLDQYDAEKHDKYQALVLAQPYASDLITVLEIHEDGITYANQRIAFISDSIEVMHDIYAGLNDNKLILICSTEEPYVHGMECGTILGLVELYDVKAVLDFDERDWQLANVFDENRDNFKDSYAMFFKNPERLVELPFSCDGEGLFEVAYSKDTLVKYPTSIHVELKDFKKAP